MSRVPDMLYHMGNVPVGIGGLQPRDARWVYSSTSAQFYKDIVRHAPGSHLHSTVALGHTALTTGGDEVAFLTPENHTLAAAVDWTKSNCHLVGMGPVVKGYNSAYMSHTCDQDVLFTVSGSNNSFSNIRILHGGNSTTNAHAMEVTGSNNSFYNCHFEGPETAAEKALSGYDLVKLTGEYSYFKDCMFGNTWATMTAASALVGFTGNNSPSAVFEDCVFQKNCGNVTNLFLHVYQAMNNGTHIHFRNCMFVNLGTSTPQYAVDGYGLSNAQSRMTFHNCSFTGVTDIVAATYEAKVWFGPTVYHADALQNGLAASPDAA